MPARKTSANGKTGEKPAIVAKEFRYRSLGDIEKKKVNEIRRGNLEAEHYRIAVEIEVVQQQPLPDQLNASEERERYVANLLEQQMILEGMINAHNEIIADIDSAIVAGKEEE